MKIRKRHRIRSMRACLHAASSPDHFDAAPFFSLAPGIITFPPDVMRTPLIVDRGEDEVWTPDGGWMRVDKSFDAPPAPEGGDNDSPSWP